MLCTCFNLNKAYHEHGRKYSSWMMTGHGNSLCHVRKCSRTWAHWCKHTRLMLMSAFHSGPHSWEPRSYRASHTWWLVLLFAGVLKVESRASDTLGICSATEHHLQPRNFLLEKGVKKTVIPEWMTDRLHFKHQGNTVRHCYSFFGKWSCTNHMRKVMWSEKYVVETSSPEWQSSRYAAEVRARNTEPSWRTAEQ